MDKWGGGRPPLYPLLYMVYTAGKSLIYFQISLVICASKGSGHIGHISVGKKYFLKS